jgi:hypothetical protein
LIEQRLHPPPVPWIEGRHGSPREPPILPRGVDAGPYSGGTVPIAAADDGLMAPIRDRLRLPGESERVRKVGAAKAG